MRPLLSLPLLVALLVAWEVPVQVAAFKFTSSDSKQHDSDQKFGKNLQGKAKLAAGQIEDIPILSWYLNREKLVMNGKERPALKDKKTHPTPRGERKRPTFEEETFKDTRGPLPIRKGLRHPIFRDETEYSTFKGTRGPFPIRKGPRHPIFRDETEYPTFKDTRGPLPIRKGPRHPIFRDETEYPTFKDTRGPLPIRKGLRHPIFRDEMECSTFKSQKGNPALREVEKYLKLEATVEQHKDLGQHRDHSLPPKDPSSDHQGTPEP